MKISEASYFEASARQRVLGILDPESFSEILPPGFHPTSPHLEVLGIPGAFDDGVVIARGQLQGKKILIASQEGKFMGGAVGEIHGAKIVGLLKLAILEKPAAVVLGIDSGGVRLHEANAGLIAISEIMRALNEVRLAGIPVIGLIGGSCGAFGGMSIVAMLCSARIISEEGRLGLSGPEVIETVMGAEEFDSKDRALVWRVTGGKHRFILGDCHLLAEDSITSFREKLIETLRKEPKEKHSLKDQLKVLKKRQKRLELRMTRLSKCRDAYQVWPQLGIKDPKKVPLMLSKELNKLKRKRTYEY